MSHEARSGQCGGCCNRVIWCFVKNILTDGAVCRRVVLVKSRCDVLTHFGSSSSHPFTKVCQNLLAVDPVNGLTFRHPIHVNNPSDVERTIIIALNLDLLCCDFFCLGELGLLRWMDWRLLSGSYWKNTIRHELLRSVNCLGGFQCFDECQHKCSFQFPSVQQWAVSAQSSNTLFHVEIVMQNVSNSFLVNVN